MPGWCWWRRRGRCWRPGSDCSASRRRTGCSDRLQATVLPVDTCSVRILRIYLRKQGNCVQIDTLMPRTRQAILAETLLCADRPVYLTELACRLRVPASSLQRELQALVDAEILERHADGNRVYFAANERC